MIKPRYFSFDQLIDRYIKILNNTQDWESVDEEKRTHLLNMLSQIKQWNYLSPKTHRWLGYVQGVMCSRKIISVQEEREITRFALQAIENQFELKVRN